MLHDLRRLYELLTARERKLAVAVTGVTVTAAGLQALTAGSLYPFLSVVSDPSALRTGRLAWLYDILGFTSERQFFVFAGLAVLVLVVVSNVALAVSHWARLRFQWGVNHRLSVRLLKAYLGRDYAYFLDENTAELHKNILTEATEVTNGLLQPVLVMLSNGAMAVAMLAVLVAVDPTATLLVAGITGGGYAGAYLLIRRRLQTLGSRYAKANRERYKATAEAFGGIKDVKVLGAEKYFLKNFKPASRTFTKTLASRQVYASLPKYVIEALAIGSLLALLVLLLLTGQPVSLIVPVMGTFAFAGYRMMPAFRDVLRTMASFRFTEEIFDAIEKALNAGGTLPPPENETGPVEPLPFKRGITLDEVVYRYPTGRRPAVRGVTLVVPKGETVALVGRTGGGKTTIIDLALGLLSPSQGQILVDGREITAENVRRWRANLGYVPQEIYLADMSVRRNIAYGIPDSEIDDTALVRAACAAHIHEFVSNGLSRGYGTILGERGVRLSGGQRQRIGIARALYHEPSVLVFDEAMSEIDGATAGKITRAIQELATGSTLIMVAHRLRSIRDCDQIHLVHGGKIVETGTYDELLAQSDLFQELAANPVGSVAPG